MRICIYLVEPKFALFYSKTNYAGTVETVFEYTGIKRCDFIQAQTRKLDSGFVCNRFFPPNVGHYSLKLLHVDLAIVPVKKVRMVASSLLLVVYCTLARFLVIECVL